MPGAKLARGIEVSNSVIPPAGIRVDSEPSKCPAGFRSANRWRMQPDFHHGLLGIVRLRTVATVVLPSRGDIPRSGTRPVRRRSSPSGVTFNRQAGSGSRRPRRGRPGAEITRWAGLNDFKTVIAQPDAYNRP